MGDQVDELELELEETVSSGILNNILSGEEKSPIFSSDKEKEDAKSEVLQFLSTKGAVSKNTAISIVSIINHFKQDSKPTPKIKKAIFGVKDSEIIKPLIDRSLIAIVEGKGSAYTTKKVFLIQAPPLSDDKDSQEELIGEPEEEIIGKPTEESLEESLQESLEESIEEESEESEDMSQDISTRIYHSEQVHLRRLRRARRI